MSDNDDDNEIGFTKEDLAKISIPCEGYGSLKDKCPHEGVVRELVDYPTLEEEANPIIKEFYLCPSCHALRQFDIEIYLREQQEGGD